MFLKQKAKLKKTQFDFDFSTLAIKGRASMGNILSRNPVRKVELCQKGVSTLSAINIYFDDIVTRLNTEERGVHLGSFKEDDKIITVYGDGYYKIVGFDLSTHFEDNLQIIKKLKKNQILTAVYCNSKEEKYMLKRFNPENTPKKIDFVPQEKNVKLVCVSIDYLPQIEITYYTKNPKELEKEIVNCAEFVEVMGVKAKGKRLNFSNIKNVKFIDPLPYDEPDEVEEEAEVDDAETEVVDNDIDMQVAKEIFDHAEEGQTDGKEKKTPGEDKGEQLSLF